jgi:hypothetical protein
MADMLDGLREIIQAHEQRRERDAQRWAELDDDECQLCGAHGADKRSLFLDCRYSVHEVVPEAIDLGGVPAFQERGYYLRLCKSCRARFLGHLREWRDECVALRGRPMDHDGHVYDDDPEPGRNIPIREHGAIRMLTRQEWDARQARRPPEGTPDAS